MSLPTSRSSTAILAVAYGSPDEEFYLRDLVRRTGFAPRTVQVQLDKLVAAGLLTERRDGNRRYLRAAKGHQLFGPLREIVMKTHGAAQVLGEHLGTAGVELAFIFGSMAVGNPTSTSDIDVLVVGDLGLRAAAARLRESQDLLGRDVNPVVWTRDEYVRRARTGDPFLARLLASPRIMLRGTDAELERMGGERLAPPPPDGSRRDRITHRRRRS